MNRMNVTKAGDPGDLLAVMYESRFEPMTAEEAHEALQAIGRAPTLEAVRVWLSVMEHTQQVERIELRRGPAYRLIIGTAGRRPAVWVECSKCGAADELTGTTVAPEVPADVAGHLVESVLMLGTCEDCRWRLSPSPSQSNGVADSVGEETTLKDRS